MKKYAIVVFLFIVACEKSPTSPPEITPPLIAYSGIYQENIAFFLMDINGNHIQRLTDYSAFYAQFSPDGTQILYQGSLLSR